MNTNESAVSRTVKAIFKRKEWNLLFLLLGMIVLLGLLRPNTFATSDNIFSVLRQSSMVAIVAVGQTFVIITSGIDLSVGYSLGLCGVIMTTLMKGNVSPAFAIAVGMSASILIGFINGILIAKVHLPPFIATLGVGYMARGIMFVMTEGYPVYTDNKFILGIAQTYIGPIPLMVLIMIIVYIIGVYLLEKNVLGMRLRAIGGNETSTKLSGVNVEKTKIGVYTLSGVFCALAGLMMVGRLTAGNPNAGANFEMDTIAATIVGGTSLAGGEGTMYGTLIGALIMSIIRNGLVLMNVSMYWQLFAIGLVIIVVCSIEGLSKKK